MVVDEVVCVGWVEVVEVVVDEVVGVGRGEVVELDWVRMEGSVRVAMAGLFCCVLYPGSGMGEESVARMFVVG